MNNNTRWRISAVAAAVALSTLLFMFRSWQIQTGGGNTQPVTKIISVKELPDHLMRPPEPKHVSSNELPNHLMRPPEPKHVSSNNHLKVSDLDPLKIKPRCFPIPELARNVTYKVSPPHCSLGYTIENSKICSGQKEWLLMMMFCSAAADFERRKIIRKLHGNHDLFNGTVFRRAFFVGIPESKEIQRKLLAEQKEFGDLVQQEFMDTYRNLSYKSVMMIDWANKNCKNAKYFLKIDIDVFLNLYPFLEYLKYDVPTLPYPFFICKVIGRHIVKTCELRNILKRKCLTRVGGPIWPQYCLGIAYVISRDAIRALHREAMYSPSFWSEDILITGFMQQQIKDLDYIFINNFFVFPPRGLLYLMENKKRVFVSLTSDAKHMQDAWALSEKNYDYSSGKLDPLTWPDY